MLSLVLIRAPVEKTRPLGTDEMIQLVGLLPRDFELATVYTAAVCTGAREPLAAAEFVRMLAGSEAAELRRAGGFEPA